MQKKVVENILHILRRILLDQSSITVDYVREEDFSDWNRTNLQFIKDSLALAEKQLGELDDIHI